MGGAAPDGTTPMEIESVMARSNSARDDRQVGNETEKRGWSTDPEPASSKGNLRSDAPACFWQREPSQKRLFHERAVPKICDNWAGLLAPGSNYWLHLPAINFLLAVDTRSVRPRLQRRDRNGVAPFSLFFSPATSRRNTHVFLPAAKAVLLRPGTLILTPGHKLSTQGTRMASCTLSRRMFFNLREKQVTEQHRLKGRDTISDR
jgi:hypothetical protein